MAAVWRSIRARGACQGSKRYRFAGPRASLGAGLALAEDYAAPAIAFLCC